MQCGEHIGLGDGPHVQNTSRKWPGNVSWSGVGEGGFPYSWARGRVPED